MSAPLRHDDDARDAGALEWCAGPVAPRDAPPTLEALRARIEAIDAQLVALVAERQRIAALVGEVKRASEQPVLDLAREAAVLRRVTECARAEQLDEEDARELWRKLLAMARRVQAEPGASR